MFILQEVNQELSNQEALELVCEKLNISQEEKEQKMASGEKLLQYRFRWTKTYLKKAGLLASTSQNKFTLTDEGRSLDIRLIDNFSLKVLSKFDGFRQFKNINTAHVETAIDVSTDDNAILPEEIIETNAEVLKESTKNDLLALIKEKSSSFFERLVVDLLVAMGYGGSHQDAAQAIGKTSDGGIDGIISEDRLGLDKIYIQAKRWENTVGRPDIQQFKGALADQVAKKGVFITTSNFSKEAIESAKKSGIVLIDGKKLTSLMIEFGLGIQIERSFYIYKIDQDRFNEENF